MLLKLKLNRHWYWCKYWLLADVVFFKTHLVGVLAHLSAALWKSVSLSYTQTYTPRHTHTPSILTTVTWVFTKRCWKQQSPIPWSCSQQGHLRWILPLSSTEKLFCVWYSVTNAVAHCPNAFNCVRKPQAFLSNRLLTIQLWLWFCTNNSTVISATRPVIAAKAGFLTLCCCDGDGRGQRQPPPHEPLQIGVGCVCLLVGGCLHFSSSQTLHVPFSFWELPLPTL